MNYEYPANEVSSSRGHMPIEEVTDYHEGRLDQESERRAEEHLDTCPACAELLAEYAAFIPTNEPAERAEGRVAADEVLARLRAERWRRVAAVAATFLIVTAGALIWSLRRSSSDPEIPQFDVALGTRGPETEIEIPASVQTFALRLAGDAIVAGVQYDVKVHDRNGQVLASRVGLVADDLGVVRIELDARAFPPSTYRFMIRPVHARPGKPTTFELALRIRLSS